MDSALCKPAASSGRAAVVFLPPRYRAGSVPTGKSKVSFILSFIGQTISLGEMFVKLLGWDRNKYSLNYPPGKDVTWGEPYSVSESSHLNREEDRTVAKQSYLKQLQTQESSDEVDDANTVKEEGANGRKDMTAEVSRGCWYILTAIVWVSPWFLI